MRKAVKVLKWLGIVLGGLLGLVVVAAVVLFFMGGFRVNRSYDIQVEALRIPTDSSATERGQHLVEAVVGCMGCHGDNLGGDKIFDDPMIGAIYATNLSTGRGGIPGDYSDGDWVRAIRHGVNPEGKGLLVMPAESYHNLSAEDLGAVIAYVKSVSPVDNEVPKPSMRPLGRVLVALGAFGEPVPAQLVAHAAPLPPAVAPGVTAEYGKYLASIAGCVACHGKDFSGGKGPEPGAPPSPNLTPGGHLGEWSEEEFISTLRTGVEPDGEELDGEFFPWETFSKMTDGELGAIWRYLKSLPPVETEHH